MAVPEVVVNRLPQYVRVLKTLLDQGTEVVSSQHLGKVLQMTPAQIRKDLSYFGRFGKQGRGYSVNYLYVELRRILGLDLEWNLAVVGVGRLGRAIISYPGFAPEGLRVVAAFDADPSMVDKQVGGITVRPMSDLRETIEREDIRMAIVAVPAARTQEVVDLLVRCGIKALLNYAPTSPPVPDGVTLRSIDPVLALQSMTYYLRAPG